MSFEELLGYPWVLRKEEEFGWRWMPIVLAGGCLHAAAGGWKRRLALSECVPGREQCWVARLALRRIRPPSRTPFDSPPYEKVTLTPTPKKKCEGVRLATCGNWL